MERIGRHALLWPLSIIFLVPWFWMITTSVKQIENIYTFPPQWIPNPVVFDAYPKAIVQAKMLSYIRNTLIIAIPTVVGCLFSNTVSAYGFSRLHWPGRDQVFVLVLATMMLPYQVRMVPVFLIFHKLHWINTFLPLIVPNFLGSAWFTFMLRQFFMTIPEDLFDAARIDGCSELRILGQVLIPLAKPALAVVALFRFMSSWNDFVGPLIYLNDQKYYPLSVGLMNLRQVYGGQDWALLMAGATIAVTPIVILFFFTQRSFIEGITLTGLKG
ncbi:MAG: carbohydrate ABC transporter permease [Anaerolineae bacterium]|nr:carbohydrate ABC transporter permease [Anaerolineae bacterium]